MSLDADRGYPYPHITTKELAARLRCRPETISRQYRRWGLRPIRIAGSLLWPLDQIEDLERRSMNAERDGGKAA